MMLNANDTVAFHFVKSQGFVQFNHKSQGLGRPCRWSTYNTFIAFDL